ncbi:MAG TPA: ATP-binding protein [Ignavibacteria bacterium]|nr:ATP-binding protein [Ignavibacteria bacterium]
MHTNIKPRISPLIITSIASMYNDPIRVLMEFIDNSFDSFSNIVQSCEETKNNINVNIKGKKHIDAEITIFDDCTGIDELSRILENIGNSDKKAQSWTNGRFGFGIFSFLAVCSKITIETKTKGTDIVQKVEILRSDFEKEQISDINFIITKIKKGGLNNSYTKVTLTDFLKDKWEEIDVNKLKDEIESHFELILKDKRINVTLKTERNKTKICKAFDYTSIEGEEYNRSFLLDPGIPESKENPRIDVFLKFTLNRSLQRLPVFITKQRRVEQVKRLKVFDSNNKTKIWSNPYLTGFVDTKSVLNPTLSRDNYSTDRNAKSLFKRLREIEPEIIDFVNKNLSLHQKTNISEIESLINDIVNKTISKFLKEKKTPDEKDFNEESDKPDAPLIETAIFLKHPKEAQQGLNQTTQKGKPDNEIASEQSKPLKFYDYYKYGTFKVKPKIKDINLTIRINPEDEPPFDNKGRHLKSELINSDVIIYKKHKEFIERLRINELGNESITESLKFYIIAEFLMHYFKLKYLDVQCNMNILDEHNILMFTLERSLEKIVGEPIIKSL